MTKLTYEELEVRCEQLRLAAEINRHTVIAQQVEYNRHINALTKRAITAENAVRKIVRRVNEKRRRRA